MHRSDVDPSKGQKKKAEERAFIEVILKVDLHCIGCSRKVVKAVRRLGGVESVKTVGANLDRLRAIGTLDPEDLRAKVEEITRRKVEVVEKEKIDDPAANETGTKKAADAMKDDNKEAADVRRNRRTFWPHFCRSPAITSVIGMQVNGDVLIISNCKFGDGEEVSKGKGQENPKVESGRIEYLYPFDVSGSDYMRNLVRVSGLVNEENPWSCAIC